MKTHGKFVLRSLFEWGQTLGFDVLPRHYYSEIPDIRQLKADQVWRQPFDMLGIRGAELNSQLAFVQNCLSVAKPPEHILRQALQLNSSDEGYGEIEAQFLYCFVRRYQPKLIIQIGCGVSTAVCLLASKAEGYQPRILCIEPYPTQFLKDANASGDIELIQKKAQTVDLALFSELASGDLLFVDSSHTLGPGGEVSRLILSILPRLAQGVFAHFHDIWFPYDYCPSLLSSDLFFMHETTLLYAFLCMNEHYSIQASLAQLFHGRQEALQTCFPQMRPARFADGLMVSPGHNPSSIYLRA